MMKYVKERQCARLRRTMNVFEEHENCLHRSVKICAPFTIVGKDVKFT